MGDVALLVDPVEHVGHRTNRPDTNIVPSVGLGADGLTGGLEVGVVRHLPSGQGLPLDVGPVSGSGGVVPLIPGPVTFTQSSQ